jgi:hypothetical protein
MSDPPERPDATVIALKVCPPPVKLGAPTRGVPSSENVDVPALNVRFVDVEKST